MMQLSDYPEFHRADIPEDWVEEIVQEIKDSVPAIYAPLLAAYETKLRHALHDGMAELLSRPLAQSMVAEQLVKEFVHRDHVVETDSVAHLLEALAEGANKLRQHY